MIHEYCVCCIMLAQVSSLLSPYIHSQAVYDYHTVCEYVRETEFRVTGLHCGVRYQFRVRPQVHRLE